MALQPVDVSASKDSVNGQLPEYTGWLTVSVGGHKDEGTITTPSGACVLNNLDRFHVVADVIDRVQRLEARTAYVKQEIRGRLIEHKQYMSRLADYMPEIKGWTRGRKKVVQRTSSTEANNV